MTAVEPQEGIQRRHIYDCPVELEMGYSYAGMKHSTSNRNRIRFWKSLWPLLIMMKVVGVWPYDIKGDVSKIHCCSITITICLSAFFCLLSLAQLGYIILVTWHNDYHTSLEGVPVLVLLFSVTFNLFTIVSKQGSIQHFMRCWERSICENSSQENDFYRKLSTFCKFVAGFVLFLNSYQVALWIVKIVSHVKNITSPDTFQQLIAPVSVLTFLTFTIAHVVCISPVALLVVWALTAAEEFNAVYKQMTNRKSLRANTDIGRWRQAHQELCHLVVATEETFNELIMMSLAVRILASLFLLDLLTSQNYNDAMESKMLNGLNILETMGTLLITSIIFDKVHVKVGTVVHNDNIQC